jgi:hypothetical protein
MAIMKIYSQSLCLEVTVSPETAERVSGFTAE